MRNGKKVSKKRIYLGCNLSKLELSKKEVEADKKLLKKSKEKQNKEFEGMKKKIIKVLKKYGIKRAGLFGSFVRGEQKKKSDVDILIQPIKGMGLDFVGLKLELEEVLERKVDLVSYNYIHPYLEKKVLDSEVKII